jgi:hypothetical protein
MILIPFFINLLILKHVENVNWKFLLLILAIYLPFMAYGREFTPIEGFTDDMEIYYKIYMAQINGGGLIFSNSKLEIVTPLIFKVIGILGEIGIKNLYLFMVVIQVVVLFFAIVDDKRSCLIFLAIIYSAPFIINSGVFVRQILAICFFLFCIKSDHQKFLRGYFLPMLAVVTHVTTILLLVFNFIGSVLGRMMYIKVFLYLLLALLFGVMIYQPLTYSVFIKIMLTIFPDQADFFRITSTVDPQKLSLTAFLFSTVIIFYGLIFNKIIQYRIIIVFLIVMITCFAFGQIPFLASRAGLIVIVFGPILFLVMRFNKFDEWILLFYPIYTLIAFSLRGSPFMRSHFGSILQLW